MYDEKLLKTIAKKLSSLGKSFFLFCCFCLISSCNLSNPRTETLHISSSTHLLPLSESLARQFTKDTNIKASVQGSFGREAQLLEKGLTDLLITTSPLEEKPANQFKNKQIAEFQTIVVTYKDNSLNQLSKIKLQKIFSGEVSNWTEVGGENKKIQLLTREPGAVMQSNFIESYLSTENGLKASNISLGALALNSNAEMKIAVATIGGSIGFISEALLDETLKKLTITHNKKPLQVKATKVYIVWKKKNLSSNEKVESFVEYLTKNANKVYEKEGFKKIEE